MNELKTDTELLTRLAKAVGAVMTPAQQAQQRASWVWGQLPVDNKLTPEQVQKMLRKE